MTHTYTYVDDLIRHVRLTPRKSPTTWRAVILGGIHGNELAALLSPQFVVRLLTYGNLATPFIREWPMLGSCEIFVVPEAHPAACAIGRKCDEDWGNLDVSWPGGYIGDPDPDKTSEGSLVRARELADWMLSLEPSAVVGLHAEPPHKHGGTLFHAYGRPESAAAAREVGLSHSLSGGSTDTTLGLPAWGHRHGIPVVSLEAPSRPVDLRAAAEHQAKLALQLLVELRRFGEGT